MGEYSWDFSLVGPGHEGVSYRVAMSGGSSCVWSEPGPVSLTSPHALVPHGRKRMMATAMCALVKLVEAPVIRVLTDESILAWWAHNSFVLTEIIRRTKVDIPVYLADIINVANLGLFFVNSKQSVAFATAIVDNNLALSVPFPVFSGIPLIRSVFSSFADRVGDVDLKWAKIYSYVLESEC